ncbi:unnamed protein product [Pleuronectes platessa]|uniref:Uncharacterized protein n=1 Tax=Pleuronectes platessa TaxID=8262 RepID=A0A9N7UTI1_PLEPL|nr:unnamed protein product [Pleuronectes platessa]
MAKKSATSSQGRQSRETPVTGAAWAVGSRVPVAPRNHAGPHQPQMRNGKIMVLVSVKRQDTQRLAECKRAVLSGRLSFASNRTDDKKGAHVLDDPPHSPSEPGAHEGNSRRDPECSGTTGVPHANDNTTKPHEARATRIRPPLTW